MKTKAQERKEIQEALRQFKGKIQVTTKEQELQAQYPDYTDYTMHLGELGMIQGGHYDAN